MQIKQALIEALPKIIAEQVKPMERIEGIKIFHVEGLNNGDGSAAPAAGGTGVADQAVSAALRYRTQAPLLDALMKELRLDAADAGGLAALSASITHRDDPGKPN